ncbi:MAG: ATP-dependent Clp protease adaptor ClpS [Planctomycetota bacterium]|jgi:ATP-dependent Clp protease adaptor protein ClpS
MPEPDTEIIEAPTTDKKTQKQPPYHVILLDDDHHTYEYVIEMLGKIFGYSTPKAFRMAREVDGSGRCIVYTGSFEQAEFKQEKIHAYGADWRIPRCAGSMSAILEPAEG